MKSDSLRTSIWIQDPVPPHNHTAVGPFSFPVLEPGLASFPFPNPAFQQLGKILIPVYSLCGSNKGFKQNLLPISLAQYLLVHKNRRISTIKPQSN